MKNQKALLESEWLPAPTVGIKEYTRKTYTTWDKKKYTTKYDNYVYRCDICETGELVLTLYKANGTPLFRSFMNTEALKSQYFEGGKPSDSTVANYRWQVLHAYYRHPSKTETDEQSRENCVAWLKDNGLVPLKSPETPLDAVRDVQHDIRKKAVKRKNERIRKSIDDNMLEIKELPKRLEKWVDDVVLKDSRYIVYQYSRKKQQEAWCSHCKSDILVSGAKHREYGKCPNCKSRAMFIARGKMQSGFSDRQRFSYIQPDKNGDPIFRYFEVNRHYHTYDFRTYQVNTYTNEEYRYFYGKNKKYEWGDFRQTGEHRFCDSWSVPHQWGFIYPYNMDKVFKEVGTKYQHIKYIPFVKLLNAQTGELNPHMFFVNIIEKPVIEYLAKLKLNRLAGRVINGFGRNDYFDSNGTSLKEVFPNNINREELSFFAKLDISPEELELYYDDAAEVKRNRFEQAIGYIRKREFSTKCIEFLKYTTPAKIVEYADKATADRHSWNHHDMRTRTGDWADYIGNALRLNWDLKDEFILFPRDFWEAHDRVSKLVKVENAKKLDKDVARRAVKLNSMYAMEGKEYFIRAAANAQEIIKEGQALHHCVATYAEKVANGETGILFMRSKAEPDKPLYTIEVKKGVIIQCRGNRNCSIKEKNEKAFYTKWENKKFKKNIREAV